MIKWNKWEDHYTRRARDEKWPARSVYKLEEIDRRFKLIRQGQHLLDLGCYPGSWSQYSIKRVGPKGEVVGVDLKKPDFPLSPSFRFIRADVFTLDLGWLATEIGPRDTVISDLSPQTTGIRGVDTNRSIELARKAHNIALMILKKRGHFLCKVFEGEELKTYKDEISNCFDQVRIVRPKAVRKGSREVYLLGLELVK